MTIVRYCAEEVARQGDTPRHVVHMIQAWQQAQQDYAAGLPLSLERVEHYGRLVSPTYNPWGFRKGAVQVGKRFPPHGAKMYAFLRQWLDAVLAPEETRMVQLWALAVALAGGEAKEYRRSKEHNYYAATAYYVFELIHPFSDGNGRTGKIILNYLYHTLDDPVFPPDFFGGIANP